MLLVKRPHFENSCSGFYSKCGPGHQYHLGVVRNAQSQASSQTYWTRSYCLTTSPGNVCAHKSLRSVALGQLIKQEKEWSEVYVLFILKTFWKDTAPPLSRYCPFVFLAGTEGGILPIKFVLVKNSCTHSLSLSLSLCLALFAHPYSPF